MTYINSDANIDTSLIPHNLIAFDDNSIDD